MSKFCCLRLVNSTEIVPIRVNESRELTRQVSHSIIDFSHSKGKFVYGRLSISPLTKRFSPDVIYAQVTARTAEMKTHFDGVTEMSYPRPLDVLLMPSKNYFVTKFDCLNNINFLQLSFQDVTKVIFTS